MVKLNAYESRCIMRTLAFTGELSLCVLDVLAPLGGSDRVLTCGGPVPAFLNGARRDASSFCLQRVSYELVISTPQGPVAFCGCKVLTRRRNGIPLTLELLLELASVFEAVRCSRRTRVNASG